MVPGRKPVNLPAPEMKLVFKDEEGKPLEVGGVIPHDRDALVASLQKVLSDAGVMALAPKEYSESEFYFPCADEDLLIVKLACPHMVARACVVLASAPETNLVDLGGDPVLTIYDDTGEGGGEIQKIVQTLLPGWKIRVHTLPLLTFYPEELKPTSSQDVCIYVSQDASPLSKEDSFIAAHYSRGNGLGLALHIHVGKEIPSGLGFDATFLLTNSNAKDLAKWITDHIDAPVVQKNVDPSDPGSEEE
jgi:hypothetical protein